MGVEEPSAETVLYGLGRLIGLPCTVCEGKGYFITAPKIGAFSDRPDLSISLSNTTVCCPACEGRG